MRHVIAFEKAREIVQKQSVKSVLEYRSLVKAHPELRLPVRPFRSYAGNWQGWGHFLGISGGFYQKKGDQLLSFEQAKALVLVLGLKSSLDYHGYLKTEAGKKSRLPSNPNKFYKREWPSWPAFLENRRRAHNRGKEFLSYQEAREHVRREEFTSYAEFRTWAHSEKRPRNIPSNPDKFYKSEWTGWIDFLNIFAFHELKRIVQEQKLLSIHEYRVWAKREGLSAAPHVSYKAEWIGWANFLGFVSFPELCEIVRAQGVTTRAEYVRLAQTRAFRIPLNPSSYYGAWPIEAFCGVKPHAA